MAQGLNPATDSNNRLWKSFSPDFAAALAHITKHAVMAQGTLLFDAGEPIQHVYFPEGGLISEVVTTRDGASIETSIVGFEGAVGIQRGFGERTSWNRANVQAAGQFGIIHGARFASLVSEHPAAMLVIERFIERQWAEAQQSCACNALHHASSRLCRWLLHAADRMASPTLPLTQEFMSQMLGVRRTTITLLAQNLQSEGLVRYSRGRLVIVNRAGLERSACECYFAIRDNEIKHPHGGSEDLTAAS